MITEETVKVKWKGLRDTYRRELKKQRSNANSSVTSENIRDPSWTHYSSMNFLREYMGNNNNNHNDIFQFHGWSAEEIPSADEASTTNDETLGAFVLTANIADLVGGNVSPSAVSARSNDSTFEDETVKTEVKVEPRSPEASEKENTPGQGANVTNQDAINSVTNVSNTSNKKNKNAEKKRSLTSLSRFSRLKEHHRLRSKLPKKHAKIHHPQTPNLAINNDDVDMEDTLTPTTAAMLTHTSGRRSNTNADESDDDLYFFKSLIPFVKNLPPTRKLYLRAEIHNLVLRELMGDGCSNSVIPLEHVAVGLNA